MRTIRNLAAICVASALLVVLGTTAWAHDVDLTIETTNTSNLGPVAYRVGDAMAVTTGASATTGVALSLTDLATGNHTLSTTFRRFTFTLSADGTLTIPTGQPLTATATTTGVTLTIDNDVSYPDFDVRMRNDTGLSLVNLIPEVNHDNLMSYGHRTPIGSTVTLDGDEADTAVSMPLIGLTTGSTIQIANNLGPRFQLAIDGDGDFYFHSYNEMAASIPSTDPDLLIIENTLDLTGFGIKASQATTLGTIGCLFVPAGPGYYTPLTTSTGYTPWPMPDGVTTRTGATVASSPATFDATGLVPGQRFRLRCTWGPEELTLSSSGVLVRTTTNLPISWSGNMIVVDNDLTIQNFRIRTANAVNSSIFTIFPSIRKWSYGDWLPWDTTRIQTTGANATTGLSFPLEGIVPGMSFGATSNIGSCHFRSTEDGLEVAPLYPTSPVDGHLEEASNGDVALVLHNPQDLWIKIYGEDPFPSTVPTIHQYVCAYRWAITNIDGIRWNKDSADFEDGELFHAVHMGPDTQLVALLNAYPTGTDKVEVSLDFRLEPDGTAVFLAAGGGTGFGQISPTKGYVNFEVDGVANTMYVEIVDPPNEAPTVTLEDGENLMIASSAQSSTTLTADVADGDGDDLLCSWYVDGVLVEGPGAPTSGESELDLGDLGNLDVGGHLIRVDVFDGMFTASDELVLTVDNSPPDVAVGGNGVYEIDDDIDVPLTAEVSDYDGDDVAYTWTTADGTVLVSDTIETTAGGSPASVPEYDLPTTSLGLGTHVLTLTVEDEDNNVVETSVTVEVADTQGPVLGPEVDTGMLWPPNHSMVEVEIDANAYDASGGSVTLSVEVGSSEPPEFDGDGNFLPDYEILSINQSTGIITLDLRAERSGKGDGRVYTVTITATDASGNISTATVDVVCPHDKS